MDSIYEIYNRQASSKIKIKEYFEEFTKVIQFQPGSTPGEEKNEPSISDIMQVELEPDKLNLIANYCSPDQLKGEGEESSKPKGSQRKRGRNIYTASEIPSNTNLYTIYELKKRLAKSPRSQSLKYKSEGFINYDKVEKSNCEQAQPGKDILIYIRVYEPFVYTPAGVDQNIPKVRLNSIIVMLGSQTLAQLRDKINCTSDLGICAENSEKSNRKPIKMAKDVYKSGFFFIENTFYNDFRDPSCIDYSDVIRKWAEPKTIGPLHTSTMEYTRVDSLNVRFGFPWVYQHQGNCEHLIIFSDARLINPDDELEVSSYPRIHRLRPSMRKYCMTCGLFPASWITMENDRVPHNPCYFCETCYDSFNYIDDQKIGSFQAYTFPSYMKLMDDSDDESDNITSNKETQ